MNPFGGGNPWVPATKPYPGGRPGGRGHGQPTQGPSIRRCMDDGNKGTDKYDKYSNKVGIFIYSDIKAMLCDLRAIFYYIEKEIS